MTMNTTSDEASLAPSIKEALDDKLSPEDTESQPQNPEGGLRGWTVVLGAFLVNFCGFGYTTSFGVYQDYYTRIYLTSESASTISWIGSINSFIVVASGLYVGRLYDRGYFYYVSAGGAALIIFSLFMLSLAKENHFYQIFLAHGLGHGIGAGLMYVPSLAIIAQYFHRKRALAMAIVAAGSSFGAILHPIMLNSTFEKLGFANTVRASAGMITGLLIISLTLMHPRLPPAAETPKLSGALKKFARDKAYIFASFGFMLFPIGMYYPLFYIQLDAIKHGLGSHFSFYTLVILNAGSFIGRLAPTVLVKPIGVSTLVTFSTLGSAILILGLIGVKTVAGFVVFGIIYGFFCGLYISLMAPLIAILTDDFRELGLRMGIALAFAGVGSLIGPPVQGALLTSQYIWWKSSLFAGILSFVGFGSFLTMEIEIRRRRRRASQSLQDDAEKSNRNSYSK